MSFIVIKTQTQTGSLATTSHLGLRLNLMSSCFLLSQGCLSKVTRGTPERAVWPTRESWRLTRYDSGDQRTIMFYFILILVTCLYLENSTQGLGGGHGNPLQCSCLENPMDRGAWWATVHGVAQSGTWLKQLSMHACMHAHKALSGMVQLLKL